MSQGDRDWGAKCGSGAYLDEGLFDVSPSEDDSTTIALGFAVTVAADVPPGKYPICFCTAGKGPDANVTFVLTGLNRTVEDGPYDMLLPREWSRRNPGLSEQRVDRHACRGRDREPGGGPAAVGELAVGVRRRADGRRAADVRRPHAH